MWEFFLIMATIGMVGLYVLRFVIGITAYLIEMWCDHCGIHNVFADDIESGCFVICIFIGILWLIAVTGM